MNDEKRARLLLHISRAQKNAYVKAAGGHKLASWVLHHLDVAARKAGHDPRDYERGPQDDRR